MACSSYLFLKCAQWLDQCGVLPDNLHLSLKKDELTVKDLAFALRDGIILCNLMNVLVPGSIDIYKIEQSVLHGSACVPNINLFTQACVEHFHMTTTELFQPIMLLDRGIERVIDTLNRISDIVEKKKKTTDVRVTKTQDESIISLKEKNSSIENLEEFTFYANCDRTQAHTILNRIPNLNPNVTLFMVRPSRNDNELAVSIKYKSQVHHLRIYSLKLHDEQIFCIFETCQFDSLLDLVIYYMQNPIGIGTLSIQTTFGVPFRDALPIPLYKATAVEDFEAMSPYLNVAIELHKHKKYSILAGQNVPDWLHVWDCELNKVGYAPKHYLEEIGCTVFAIDNYIGDDMFSIVKGGLYSVIAKLDRANWKILAGTSVDIAPASIFTEIASEVIAVADYRNDEMEIKMFCRYFLLEINLDDLLWKISDSDGHVARIPANCFEIIKCYASALAEYIGAGIKIEPNKMYAILNETTTPGLWRVSDIDTTIGFAPGECFKKIEKKSYAIYNFNPKDSSHNDTIELKKDEKYWVVAKNEKYIEWCTVYNSNGLVGQVPISCLREEVEVEVEDEDDDEIENEITYF